MRTIIGDAFVVNTAGTTHCPPTFGTQFMSKTQDAWVPTPRVIYDQSNALRRAFVNEYARCIKGGRKRLLAEEQARRQTQRRTSVGPMGWRWRTNAYNRRAYARGQSLVHACKAARHLPAPHENGTPLRIWFNASGEYETAVTAISTGMCKGRIGIRAIMVKTASNIAATDNDDLVHKI
jgi:hypothetical protein